MGPHGRRRNACRGLFAAAALFGLLCLTPTISKANAPPQYFEVDRLVLPVIRRHGLEGHLTLQIYLELYNTDHRTLLLDKMPILRDVYIATLNRYIAHRPRVLYKVQLREIKAIMLTATERVIGPGKIKAVLIKAVANRRF